MICTQRNDAEETTSRRPPRILHYGLGPVGCAVARELARRGGEIVGAVDIDPVKAGRDLGEVAGLDRELGVAVRSEAAAALEEARADLVVLTTTSSLEAVLPQVREIAAAGADVVTTCEELSYPWETRPELARELDAAARAAGASVLATGVNPGFLMDLLPVVLGSLCREVRSVRVERFLDASPRRLPFQRKIGAGLDLETFRAAVAAGRLRHVGLPESLYLLARGLGWRLSRVEEEIRPVLAGERLTAGELTVEPGRASGVEQVGRGFVDGEQKITLCFRAAIGEPRSIDRVRIDATPPIDLTLRGGVNGDLATCNIVVNAIPRVLAARPGLLTMLDLAPPGTW